MKKINLIIGITIALLLTVTSASAVTTCIPDGIYCGNLEGTYTSPQLPDQSFTLYASVGATVDNGIVTLAKVDPTGSNPAIDNLVIDAIYNETSGLIEVTASGTCMPQQNQFTGYMEIDPCNNFEVVSATGSVDAIVAQFTLVGDFTINMEPCEYIPEFPTIAIPMAAIVGLAFFMQRRKD